MFQQLVSEFELCFHGLGGGTERLATVGGLVSNQLWITNNLALFYNAVHDKQSSVRSKAKHPAKHQMPPSLVPLYFLFRCICLSFELAEPNTIIPSLPSRTHTMKEAVCQHFQIDPANTSVLDIRHLYTSITNIVHNEHNESSDLVADDAGALSNNHSPAVHRKYYSTAHIGAEARRFSAYHHFLGENLHSSDCSFTMTLEPITSTQQRRALQCLFGQLAIFNDCDQEQMIEFSCNSSSKHKYFGIRCGMGKSLSLLIPITIEKLTRRFSGCRVFVLPYAFLKDSAHEAFRTKLNQFKDYLDIQSYAASSITDSSLPIPLTNENPPDILLLTVDAAANLIQYHPSLLRTWHATKALRGVWFDEIQCLFDEYGFRQVYQKLPLYASIGAPVTLLSGSFPYELVESTMKYLKLLPENEILDSNVDVVKSKDLVGSGFTFEVVVVNDIIADTIDLMKDFCSSTG